MLVPLMGACAETKQIEWTEDMRLSDGRTLVVQRYEEYRRVTDPGAGFRVGWLFQRARISAELPAPIQRKISWEGNLKPLVLDIQPGNFVYLVGRVATGAGRTEWKVPDHEYYVIFRMTNEGWQRIPIAELPLSVMPNLLGRTSTLFIDRQARSGIHVDLELKKELDTDIRTPKVIKSIVRERLPAEVY
jgi:hypothetical protein